jgi:hypothetical protein
MLMSNIQKLAKCTAGYLCLVIQWKGGRGRVGCMQLDAKLVIDVLEALVKPAFLKNQAQQVG